MKESFSVPRAYSKRRARREIEEGLVEVVEEYNISPKSREGVHRELIENFEQVTTPEPLSRKEVELEAAAFVERHLRDLVPIMSGGWSLPDISSLIERFDLTNEQIGLLGEQYFIREDESGKKGLYKTDEWNPDGRPADDVQANDLLALVWAKEGIRIDTRGDANSAETTLSHRFFLRSKGRYLSTNDYGMRSWDDPTNQMNEPDVRNAVPFIRTVKQQLTRISENLTAYSGGSLDERITSITQAGFAERGADAYGQLPNGEHLDWEETNRIQQAALATATQEVQAALLTDLEANPRNRELLFTGVTSGKVLRQLHFKYESIGRKFGVVTNDPMKDYENFGRNARYLEMMFEEPTEAERQGATIDFVKSEFYDKPIIFGGIERERTIRLVQDGVREVLGLRAAKADPETAEMIETYRCKRGWQSPYKFSDADLYDFIKAVGAEKARAILAADDRDVSRQVKGWWLLEKLGFNIGTMEPDRFRKQLFEANRLQEKGLWDYLEHREAGHIDAARARAGKRGEGRTWMEHLGVRASRNLFFEGKRMYWLAQQVHMRNPNRAEGDKFYNHYTNWDSYDLSEADVPEAKLTQYLDSHNNFIVALLGESEFAAGDEGQVQGKQATLGLIMQAFERNQDLRGVALAYDKKAYLRSVIDGYDGQDVDLALSGWPIELRTAVSQGEINVYYEYANDYILRDPNGLVRYATWRASDEGRDWTKIFTETPESKSELDFRLCLAAQTPEIRGWYKDAVEYVGDTAVQNYLLRFNATRGTDGRLANWHDVLFWVPNIRKLEAGEARAILGSIQTMDDNQEFINFLPRYIKERDRFREQGAVQSLRELKKRVFAIESNIDLSDLPSEILEITSAPGFNLSALEELRRRADFHDLVEGKLDAEQPFNSHTRVFAGRPLTDALKEGLGSFKNKIRGTAKDPKGFFHEVRQLIKGRMVGEKQMEVTDLFQNVPIDIEEDIIRLLQKQQVDIGSTVEAQVHAKSDPEGWVCGNYTDCCMPFGDYKNTDYMFGKSTQFFTIKYNGRIVAQSVVIDGQDHRNGQEVVILDNIEVANNYKNLSPLLARVYQTFWTEYTSRPVKVGTGYSDLIPPGGKLEANNYSPKTYVAYSDATGSRIYDLPKIRGIEALDEIVTFANLTERDAELIAKLETEIYPEGMVQGKAHIADILRKQRELEVPGAASSFVLRQGDEAAGYLLVLPEESQLRPGTQAAHVYDMAIHPKFQGKGLARQMMERVLDIASAYEVAIEAEARASTSYAMLMNDRVRTWFEGRGFVLTHNEKMEKYLGGEDFYIVRFEYRGASTE